VVAEQNMRAAAMAERQESWLALSGLLAAAFLGTLDTTVVNIALRTVQKDFGATLQQVQLVGSGYILAFAAALVLGGKAGDKFGRRAVFRTGVVFFLVLSVGCALAPSLPALIVLRVAQGLSAALMVPQVLAIIKASFPQKAQVGMSLYGATLGMATISGMIVGGLLVGVAGWRAVFLINVPIYAFILLADRKETLPESRGTVRGFDVLGPVLLILAMVTILAPVSLPGFHARGLLAVLAIGFVVLLVGFCRHEKSLERRKGDIALVPAAMFRYRSVAMGLLILGIYFVGTAGFNVVLAYYLQVGDGLSQSVTGLVCSTLGVGFVVGSAFAHRVTAWLGSKAIVVGCVLMVVTRLLLIAAQSLPHATGLILTSSLAGATGAAQGIVVPPLMTAVLSTVSTRLSGVASGVLLMICNCAIALGQAVFLGLYSAAGRSPVNASAPFVTTLWAMAALAALTAAVSASALPVFRRDEGMAHEDSLPQ